jgi:hypothetical protein
MASVVHTPHIEKALKESLKVNLHSRAAAPSGREML